MKTLTAKATRAGDWWAIEVPEVPGLFTQAKRLDQIEDMVRDAASLLVGASPEVFEVVVVPEVADELRRDIDQVHALMTAFAEAQEQASVIMRRAVMRMRHEGLTVRDVGKILGISPQRVSQLEASARGKTS